MDDFNQFYYTQPLSNHNQTHRPAPLPSMVFGEFFGENTPATNTSTMNDIYLQNQQLQNQNNMGQSLGSTPISNSPNFDQMYQQNPTPLVNANSPAPQQMGPPPLMAANEALGGSGFGSMF